MGLSPWTLRSWINNKKIDVVRLGRAVRIPEETVHRLVEQGFREAEN